jgi:hypothetical protein
LQVFGKIYGIRNKAVSTEPGSFSLNQKNIRNGKENEGTAKNLKNPHS